MALACILKVIAKKKELIGYLSVPEMISGQKEWSLLAIFQVISSSFQNGGRPKEALFDFIPLTYNGEVVKIGLNLGHRCQNSEINVL